MRPVAFPEVRAGTARERNKSQGPSSTVHKAASLLRQKRASSFGCPPGNGFCICTF